MNCNLSATGIRCPKLFCWCTWQDRLSHQGVMWELNDKHSFYRYEISQESLIPAQLPCAVTPSWFLIFGLVVTFLCQKFLLFVLNFLAFVTHSCCYVPHSSFYIIHALCCNITRHRIIRYFFASLVLSFVLHSWLFISQVLVLLCNISNTQNRVWSLFKTPRREFKIQGVADNFWRTSGVWKCAGTLSWVFDVIFSIKIKSKKKTEK